MAWAEFILAFLVFFVSHSVPVRPGVKEALVRRIGRFGFSCCYSALSLAVLIWLVGAAGRAPFVPVWNWAPWQTHLALGLMFLACLIIALSLGRPNPFSFGSAQNHRFDAAKPGIIRLGRHPLLLALGLWAIAHLFVNGDLAHVLLFGVFAIFALSGGRLVDRRKRRELGPRWDALVEEVQGQPLKPALRSFRKPDVVRICCAVLIYLALIGLHPLVIGVSPLM
ncbi:MAG: NnrU family protein [Pseudomonadota bacterium]